MIETYEIKGHTLEYIDDIHTYLIDGVCVPSITQIIHKDFKDKYKDVPDEVLKKASERGTYIHKQIELYCKNKKYDDIEEVQDFKFLQDYYKFKVVDNEVPIILFKNNKPIGAGRLDLVIKDGKNLGLADIKTTSNLDKKYLKEQLNLYKKGYEQSYDKEIKFLKGIWLKNGKRKYVDIEVEK